VHSAPSTGSTTGVGDASVTIKNGGVNVAGDGLVDRFVDAATFKRACHAALAVSHRRARCNRRASALSEKATGAGGTCETTMAFPTWSGGTFDLSADPNWQCYRYRVFETTVPLRNWIWKSS